MNRNMKYIKNIVLCALLAFGFSVQAANPVALSFMGTAKQITLLTNGNQTFVYPSAEGIPYVNGNLIGAYSGKTNYIMPTVDANNLYWYTNTLQYSNTTLGGLTTNNTVAPFPFIDVPSFADANGGVAAQAIGVSMIGANASATNPVTFTFVPSVTRSFYGGTADSAGIGVALKGPFVAAVPVFYSTNVTQRTFTFTVPAQGTTLANYITNIPAVQGQGVLHWRLHSVNVLTNVAVGMPGGIIYLNGLELRGYAP
jgi:hypothetical protein